MRWPEKHFVFSEQHRFLYIPIEKVACSSLKSWVIELNEGGGPTIQFDPNAHIRSHYELQALPVVAGHRLLRDKSLFRFAFVRNPWDRLVSGFLNKFVPWKSPAEKFAAEHDRRMKWRKAVNRISAGWFCRCCQSTSAQWRDDLTFRQFVAQVRQRNPRKLDLHWRPQHLFLGSQKLDFLGRFENLADDFRILCGRLELRGELREANKTSRNPSVHRHLADAPLAELRTLAGFPGYQWFYTPDLIEKVADLYAEDIRQFKYAFQQTSSPRSLRAA
jgi:hypothetical protein